MTFNFEAMKQRFNEQAFNEFRVTVHLVNVVGGTPADPQMIGNWINATCKAKSAEEKAKIVEATVLELPDIADDREARSWTIFKRDDRGLYLEGRCIKSGLKEAANIIKEMVGIKALKSKVADQVFVVEDRCYFTRGGQPIKEVTQEERAIHVMTASGPRNSLKRFDILYDVDMTFTVKMFAHGTVTEEALGFAILYLQDVGLGSDRSQGFGKNQTVECVKVR